MLVASYKTKKDLKAAVGKRLRFVETSMFGSEYKSDGKFAVVFENKNFPRRYMGRNVIVGDDTDLRFLDKTPSIVALYAKGRGKVNSSYYQPTGFVVPLGTSRLTKTV